ncbi:ABC transporter permease [Acidihalobacter prosperus]|uniref:Membrane protein n=1 Tax=Acidihalobacter prosperus TaxID=160660 RepID=A0A1A6C7I8_9GAMM|nr:ABC transporter permease [Acidihalobacter prosperus]OBS10515.1 membrane protein [Acidihalobacter prosperus]
MAAEPDFAVRHMHLRGLIRKEGLQILRDPSSIAIAFLMPIVLLLLFGYGVSLDANHVPIGFVTGVQTAQTQSLIGAFHHSRYIEPVRFQNMQAARAALMAHRIDAIVRLQDDFSARLLSRRPVDAQLIVNGVDANKARIVQGYVGAAVQGWLQQRERARGRDTALPVTLVPRIWFNSEVRSRDYLVPGLVAVIMTLIGALLTALVMAREWERGTLEALMVTPVTLREILIGKLLPYFILGMGGMTVSLVMALWLFDVPLRGSLIVLVLCSALFLLAALGMGLLISVIARNQFVAALVAIIATFLPAFLLSGFIFDINSMPVWLQWLTHLVAARYFVAILQTLFLAGDVWSVILPNALALAIMATFFIGVSRLRMSKRLE